MNVLEKILERVIDDLKEEGIIADNDRGHRAVEIIRSHMDEVDDDGWIPVEERVPNQNGVYNVTRLIDDAFISDSAYFDGQDTWHNDNRVNHARPYLTDIVAWQPLPERYKGDDRA